MFFFLRRRLGFRKSVTWRQTRPKPRPRVLKQNLIPGDISTQETTTTPGPNSSDSHFSGEDVDEEVMDISVRPSGFSTGNDSNEMLCDSDMLQIHTQHQVCTNKEVPLTYTSMEGNSNISLLVDGLSYNGINCSRLGSDLSTAAQSSETSEHEQSGSERQLLYLVARGNLEPLHAMMGNTNSNNGNSSKKTSQPANQNNSVPVPKPRTGRPFSTVNGVLPDKEKTEKPKVPPKPAAKPPVKRYSSSSDQSSTTTAVAMKRMSSPGIHISKRYSITPAIPSQEGAINSQSSTSTNTASTAMPAKVTTSAVKKLSRHYETFDPPAISTQSEVAKQKTVMKQQSQSPKMLSKVLSQKELKEIYSFVDTEKLRAQRETPPPVVKPYKSSAGSSGMEDATLSDSDSGKIGNNSKVQKPKPINIPPLKPMKPLMPKPLPAKRHSLERSQSFEALGSPCLENTSFELGKSRSFGPADMVKITQPKGRFSFLKTRALSFGRKKTNSESSPKSTIKSEASPPTTSILKSRKPLESIDLCDRPQSPQLSPAMALKQSSLDRADTIHSTEPHYETAEGFFHQVSRILKKMTISNRTESMNNPQGKDSKFQEEHIYETAEGVQARIPLSPATWMKKKLQRSASQTNKKSMYVKAVERTIRRTPSMDCLDDRMLRTTLEVSSSDEDGDLDSSFLSSWRSCKHCISAV